MWDIIRKIGNRLRATFFKAGFATLMTVYGLLICMIVTQKADMMDPTKEPLDYAGMIPIVLGIHVVWTCILICSPPVRRTDAELIGKHFRGMRRIDRHFCKALDFLMQDRIMESLEGFRDLLDEPLSREERGIVEFYLARTYQLTGCPSNAVQHYEESLACGFESGYRTLFHARSQMEAGMFEDAFATYQLLLEKPIRGVTCIYTDIGMLFLRARNGEKAAQWFEASIERGENYPFALGGCALAQLLLGNEEKSKEYYEQALLNRMPDPEGFREFYEEIADFVKQNKS